MENQEKENISQPHVKIFNEEIDSWGKEDEKQNDKNDNLHYHHHRHHHYHHRHIGGGIFGLAILFAGALLLLNNFGIVGKEVWNYVWPFWPILLILIGIRIISGFSRIVSFFVFILALVMFCGIILYALVHIGSPLVYNLNMDPSFINFISQLK